MPDNTITGATECSYDPYESSNLLSPYEGYDELRKMGPAVWLTQHNMYALTHYDIVKQVLTDDETFISGEGIMMNEPLNEQLKGASLTSDGDHHKMLRGVTEKPLSPAAVRSLQDEIKFESETLVDELVEKHRFDGVQDLAWRLPLAIVSNLVGIPEEGRSRMLVWSEAVFNAFGPLNALGQEALPILQELFEYANTRVTPESVRPGSWADGVFKAVERGEAPKELAQLMILDYIGPSLDTTISATGSALWLFGNAPDQWDLIREDPRLIRNAVNEVLRLESPVQSFSRYVKKDANLGGTDIPAGSRVICFYGAANRDPQEFPDPTRLDVTRKNANTHLAFGAGSHQCMGMNLARLEMAELFTALARRVKRFHIHGEERITNNLIRAFRHLDVEIESH
jgi:cytochrome P450